MRFSSNDNDGDKVSVQPELANAEGVAEILPAVEGAPRTTYAGRVGSSGGPLSRLASNPLQRMFVLAVAGAAAFVSAYLARGWVERWDARVFLNPSAHPFAYPWMALIALCQIVSAYAAGIFQPLNKMTLKRLVSRVGLTALLASLVILSVSYVTGWSGLPRSIAAFFLTFDFAFLVPWAVTLQRLERNRPERFLLLGPWRETDNFLQALQTLPTHGRAIFPGASADLCFGNGASVEDARRILQETRPDRVYLVRGAYLEDHVLRLLEAAPEGVSFYVVPSTWDSLISRLALGPVLGDLRLFEMRSPMADLAAAMIKRTADAAFAALGLAALALPFALVAVLIKATSPGPVFYSQVRVGRRGRRFRIVKFRTMQEDAEDGRGETLATENDPRVTRVGRWLRAFRIDELPQLWNVLRGDMSLVGPRPERPGRVALFHGKLPGYGLRHQVRPGITGLAQIYGHYHSHPREKLRFDLAYIYNYSLGLDCAIAARTLWRILTTRSTRLSQY